MKKNLQPARTLTQPAKKLFGVSTDQLKAVHGGGGVVGHIDEPVTPPPTVG